MKSHFMKFYYSNLELEVPDSVYCPREDSLLLAKAIEKLCLKGKKALDMGCGSGFLSILMTESNDVTSADINEEAVRITRDNAARNNVKLRALQSDLFSNIHEMFDIIVFNPPYLPDEGGDRTYSGGRSGRDTIEKFIVGAKNHLNKGGIILLLISSLTGEKEVLESFERNHYKTTILAREKIPWEELMIIEAHIF